MNKKDTKKRKIITGVCGMLCILAFFVSLVMLSMQVMAGEVKTGMLVSELLVCAGMLWIINTLNVVFDTADGYASIHSSFGTWARNTLFGGLLYLYLCAFVRTVSRFYDAEVLSRAATVEGIMLMGVTIAIFLHLHNEKYLQSRKTRIRRLMEKGNLNRKRRFSMIVEKSDGDQRNGFMVYGRLIGEIHTGDRIMIYAGKQPYRTGRVRRIIMEGKKVKRARDTLCGLLLGDYLQVKPERLSVISSTRQYHESDTENSTENPFLRAYLFEYSRRFRDPVYFYHLISAVIHAYYLVPGFYPDGNKERKDIMDKLASTHISFPSVNNKDHPKEAILAVFTDWDTLRRWPDMMASTAAATTVMNFRQVLALERMGYKGIVINPFGPVPFYLNRELVDRILMNPEYMQEINAGKDTDQ